MTTICRPATKIKPTRGIGQPVRGAAATVIDSAPLPVPDAPFGKVIQSAPLEADQSQPAVAATAIVVVAPARATRTGPGGASSVQEPPVGAVPVMRLTVPPSVTT